MVLRQGHGQNGACRDAATALPAQARDTRQAWPSDRSTDGIFRRLGRSEPLIRCANALRNSTATANPAQASGSARISSASRPAGSMVVTATIDGAPVVSRRVRCRCNEWKGDGSHAVMQATDSGRAAILSAEGGWIRMAERDQRELQHARPRKRNDSKATRADRTVITLLDRTAIVWRTPSSPDNSPF